jgi:hypothetical protein
MLSPGGREGEDRRERGIGERRVEEGSALRERSAAQAIVPQRRLSTQGCLRQALQQRWRGPRRVVTACSTSGLQEFDSSYSRNTPFKFTIGVGQVGKSGCSMAPEGVRSILDRKAKVLAKGFEREG